MEFCPLPDIANTSTSVKKPLRSMAGACVSHLTVKDGENSGHFVSQTNEHRNGHDRYESKDKGILHQGLAAIVLSNDPRFSSHHAQKTNLDTTKFRISLNNLRK
jgi:hypothetical protein